MIRIVLLLSLVTSACELPRDPNRTLENIQASKRIRVGVMHAPPWANVQQDPPHGVEVQLVEELARELGAEVRWMPAAEGALFPALERDALDLVVGGVTQSTPWRSRLGLTRPYYTSELTVGVPPGREPVDEIDGQRVAVVSGDLVAASIAQDEGAEPVEDAESFGDLPVVADRFQIEAMDWRPGEETMHTAEHVFAAPPGENAWIVYLDRFLYRQQARVPELLREGIEP